MGIIPLEKYPDVASKYGVAFGWINLLQEELKLKILLSQGINPIPNIIMDVFDDMTLGQMIAVAEPRIKDEKLIGYFRDLNNKRRILAHGTVGEKAYSSKGNPIQYTGELSIRLKSGEFPLLELLDDIISLAKKIDERMKPNPLLKV